jgi:hypothetical protein
MPTGTSAYRADQGRVAIGRATAFVAEVHDVAQTAPAGQVLGVCEAQAVERGQELVRGTLRRAVQARVDAAEEKKGRPGRARAGAGSAARGGAPGR